jgi:hypothetical protein
VFGAIELRFTDRGTEFANHRRWGHHSMPTKEHQRLQEAGKLPWRFWGPYLTVSICRLVQPIGIALER